MLRAFKNAKHFMLRAFKNAKRSCWAFLNTQSVHVAWFWITQFVNVLRFLKPLSVHVSCIQKHNLLTLRFKKHIGNTLCFSKCHSWALALFFQVCSLLSAHFLSMDCYRYSHFANFQVRSSLNRSQINQWFTLKKEH